MVPVGDGQATVLETRIPLRRLLLALAELRQRSPNAVLPVTAAFEAGWPGERATPTAAAMRVYTAVHSLRRFGLRGLLVRRRRGYVLDLDVVILANESQIPPGMGDLDDVAIPPSSRAPSDLRALVPPSSTLSMTSLAADDEDAVEDIRARRLRSSPSREAARDLERFLASFPRDPGIFPAGITFASPVDFGV